MGWYRLRTSGVLYYTEGATPPGATPVDAPSEGDDGPEGGDDAPAVEPTDDLLAESIPVIVEHVEASDADLDTIERLLTEEHAGAARKGLIDQLARMRDRLTEQE